MNDTRQRPSQPASGRKGWPRRRARLCGSWALAWWMAAIFPVPALGASFLELAGAPPSAHPFAGRVLPGGPDTAYFNPALLPEVPKQFSLGLFYLWQGLDIALDPRPAGADIPESIYTARLPSPDGGTTRLTDRPIPTARLPRPRGGEDASGGRLYLHLGAVMKFWKDRVALAFLGALPAAQFQAQRPFYVDEREQAFSNSLHFERLEDRLEPNAFVLSLGVRPIPQFSLGAGVRIATGSVVRNEIYVPDSGNQATSLSDSEITVRTRVTGHVGLSARPWRGLRAAVTVHLEESSPSTTKTRTRFWNESGEASQGNVSQSSRVFNWEPLRVGFGAGWDGEPSGVVDGWRVGVAGLWQQWSRYQDRQGERPVDRWSDTVSLSAGGEVTIRGHRLSGDFAWDPTPVPDQSGRSNYVDSDRLGGSLAWEASWPVGRVRIGAQVGLEVQGLLPRRATKDPAAPNPVRDEFPDEAVDGVTGAPAAGAAGLQTHNPGWPGWRARAWMLGGGASVKVFF